MEIQEIQDRLDRMAVAMGDRGVKLPVANLVMSSGDTCPTIMLGKQDAKYHAVSSGFHWPKGDTLADRLDNADAFIAALPPPEEARRNEFMAALGKVIDLGRENGIDLDYLNPLSATMKRLSENALTDQRAAK